MLPFSNVICFSYLILALFFLGHQMYILKRNMIGNLFVSYALCSWKLFLIEAKPSIVQFHATDKHVRTTNKLQRTLIGHIFQDAQTNFWLKRKINHKLFWISLEYQKRNYLGNNYEETKNVLSRSKVIQNVNVTILINFLVVVYANCRKHWETNKCL